MTDPSTSSGQGLSKPSNDAPIYLVLHETKIGKHRFRTLGAVYDLWEEADRAAKQHTIDFKVRAWVVGFEAPMDDPKLEQMINDRASN